LLHSLGLVYKSMRGMMTNSIDRDQWLNVTSESQILLLLYNIVNNHKHNITFKMQFIVHDKT
jgi:hypothetical protein